MTSAYTIIAVIVILCALVATLTWLSYKYGRVTLINEQNAANITVMQETENELEKLKNVSPTELDARLSPWMRDNK